MSAVPLTDRLQDIAERKEWIQNSLKQLGIAGVYAFGVLVLSTVAFFGSKYYLSQIPVKLTDQQSIATNFPTK